MRNKVFRRMRGRLALLWVDESGMSTVEYAIGTIVIRRWRNLSAMFVCDASSDTPPEFPGCHRDVSYGCVVGRKYITERAISPGDFVDCYVVVDSDTYMLHVEACEYLSSLRAAGRSPNTERIYAGRIAKYLSHCAAHDIDWNEPSFEFLATFLRFLSVEPLVREGSSNASRRRANGTSNAIMITVCEFLRFCCSRGWTSHEIVERLSKPKFLHHVPSGFSSGEQDEFRKINVRTLKLPSSENGIELLSQTQIDKVLSEATRPRDRLLVTLLRDTGMRIGEALGLRREDLHLTPNSSALRCSTVGAHVHVRRRMNANGALAKSRRPRSIPMPNSTIDLYVDYLHDRAALVAAAADCDFVFVNLYRPPIGAPMRYDNAKQLFCRLSAAVGFAVRPHMFRHAAASNWLSQGVSRDVVQSLLGHVDSASMEVYLHTSDAERRAAVELVSSQRKLP